MSTLKVTVGPSESLDERARRRLKASSALQARGVVKKMSKRPAKVDFDMESIANIKEVNQRRQRAEALMEDL